jgi:hypothetical protein
MLQADVVRSGLGLAVMAHPPATESDLTLEDFLRITAEHNDRLPEHAVGTCLRASVYPYA